MTFILAFLVRGLVLALSGVFILKGFRRASAATRVAVCAVAMAALLALPLGLLAAPKRPVSTESLPATMVPIVQNVSVPVAGHERAVAPAPEGRPSAALDIATAAIGIWGLGAGALLVRLAFGAATAIGWARRARPYGSGENEIRVSSEIGTPCVVWAGRSMILLPSSHGEWSEERRRAVLVHESSHVRRGDWFVLVLSRLAVAFHWPNPFAWSLLKAVRQAVEDAADDKVLESGTAAADYAQTLLSLARRSPGAALALPMAAKPDIDRRIRQVLNPRRIRGRVRPFTILLASLLIGAVLTPAICLVAENQAKRLPLVSGGAATGGEPGTATNGFVARLPDGRRVELVQVAHRIGGETRFWRGDGTSVEPRAGLKTPLAKNPNLRTIVLRVPGPTIDLWNGSERASKRLPGDVAETLFGWGGDLEGAEPSHHFTYGFVGPGDQISIAFPLVGGRWSAEAAFPMKRGLWGDSGRLRAVTVVGEMWTTTARSEEDEHKHENDGRLSTCLSYRIAGDPSTLLIRPVAILKDGREAVCPSVGELVDGPRGVYVATFGFPSAAIERFEIRTRPIQKAEFLGVRLKPNAP